MHNFEVADAGPEIATSLTGTRSNEEPSRAGQLLEVRDSAADVNLPKVFGSLLVWNFAWQIFEAEILICSGASRPQISNSADLPPT